VLKFSTPESQQLNKEVNVLLITNAHGVATRYGLDGPGIESQWERDFPHSYTQALGPTHHPTKWIPYLSRG